MGVCGIGYEAYPESQTIDREQPGPSRCQVRHAMRHIPNPTPDLCHGPRHGGAVLVLPLMHLVICDGHGGGSDVIHPLWSSGDVHGGWCHLS